MNATAANLIERVLPPERGLRQWVLTFPFSWRRRLAQDGALLGRLTRMVVETVLALYAARAREEGGLGAKSGAVEAARSGGVGAIEPSGARASNVPGVIGGG